MNDHKFGEAGYNADKADAWIFKRKFFDFSMKDNRISIKILLSKNPTRKLTTVVHSTRVSRISPLRIVAAFLNF